MQILTEAFSNVVVPVFLADIKGDLSGLSSPGIITDIITARIQYIGIENFHSQSSPVVLWEIFAESGHPVRTTISDMGRLSLSSLLVLNDTQTDVLYSGFNIADDNGLL